MAKARGSERGFRHAQTVSASLVSLAHGTNDAQKTMGVITLTLIVAGYQAANTSPQVWVILICGLAIGTGTYMGGWRIMRTVGKRITDIEAAQGFSAETSSAATILISSTLGFPLSTTQVTSGSVVGAGPGKKLAAGRWGMCGRVAAAWAAAASVCGPIPLVVLGAAGAVGFLLLARRKPITRQNVNDEDSNEAGES